MRCSLGGGAYSGSRNSGVEHVGDLQDRVEADEVREAQRSHRVVHAERHRGVDILAAREPLVEQADRRADVRDHESVHDEAGVVLRHDHGLAKPFAEPSGEGDRLLARRQRRGELHEAHYRRRG